MVMNLSAHDLEYFRVDEANPINLRQFISHNGCKMC